MIGQRAAVLLGLLAIGCADADPRAPFDLDSIEQPDDCVAVVHERLELGHPVLEYLADGPGSVGGWAVLVETSANLANHHLRLVRVPASPDEPETSPIYVGSWSSGALRVELRPGTWSGELWALVEIGSVVSLTKLRPGIGVVTKNAFPAVGGGAGCPKTIDRQLLMIDERPFVIALPDCSDSTALELQLLEFDRESVLLRNSWLLTFDPCASDPQCGLAGYPYKLEQIRGGEATLATNLGRTAIGFTQVRKFDFGVTSVDISLLELWLTAGAPEARIITFQGVWQSSTNLGPVELAHDQFSTQLHVRNLAGPDDAALVRFDDQGELYVQIKSPLVPLRGRGRLVQLDYQSAILDVHEGVLEAVPLIDIGSWPSWAPRVLHELDDLVGFEPAGVGHLLLRRSAAPPQVVQLRCAG